MEKESCSPVCGKGHEALKRCTPKTLELTARGRLTPNPVEMMARLVLTEREFFIDSLLARIPYTIVMIK